MARTKKKIKNNYHGAQGFALFPHSLLPQYSLTVTPTISRLVVRFSVKLRLKSLSATKEKRTIV